jgi:4-cresol dehydrogenase (hydroxylating)
MSEALRQFEAVVGKEWVFSSDEDVDLYRDSYSPFWHEPEERVPSAAVAPDAVEQVQQIVRIAGKYKIPLWTISTGKNLGYGGSRRTPSGTVVLDLKRMNRIIEVNDKNHYALVEPGVSYFDLYRHIQERGLKVWIDPPDPGWGSLIGNALERGGGYTPMRDHFDCHCGMEVVLANGDVVRTGMGALPNARTWQQYKYGFGPAVDGIFSQSNFGVVTKMGFWLLPEPEAYFSGTVMVPKEDDIHALVEIFARLLNSGVVQGTTSVLKTVDFGPPDPQLAAVRVGASTSDLERYVAQKGLGYWTLDLPFYGPSKVIAAQWEHAKEQFSWIPGVQFRDGASYTFPLTREAIEKIPEPRSAWNPEPHHVCDRRSVQPGPYVVFADHPDDRCRGARSDQGVRAGLSRSRIADRRASWSADLVVSSREPSSSSTSFLSSTISRRTVRNREIFRRLIKAAAEHGWGEYRTHTAFMDDIAEAYSYNNHALRRLHETLKDALDPDGILAPGKNGVWPKRLRRARA